MNLRSWFSDHFRCKLERFAWWEMLLMRALFAWLVFRSLPFSVPFHTMPHPNGVAQWLDLTFLARPQVCSALRIAAIPCLVAFVAGFGSILSLGYLFLLNACIGTLLNSQGAIGHFSQLQTLVVGSFWAAAVWDQIQRWRHQQGLAFWDPLTRQRTMIHACRVLVAATYLTAACSKIEGSRGRWFWEAPNLSVQLVKTQNNMAADTGAPVDPFLEQKLPELILAHPNLTRIVFSPGLWLEFIVFLGLIGRGWSLMIGLSVIVLHEMISRIMALYFYDHQAVMGIFYVNLPFWFIAGLGVALTRFHRMTSGQTNQATAYLFYDADCGICTKFVEWLRSELPSSRQKMELIAYQTLTAPGQFPEIDRSHMQAGVQFITPPVKVHRDAEAIADVLSALPYWFWLGRLLNLPGVATLAQAGYRLVAANRQRISRIFGLDACKIADTA